MESYTSRAAGISTISYWEELGIVVHIFAIWYLFKSVSKEITDENEPVAEIIPLK